MQTRDTALSWQTGVRKKKCKKTERKGRKKNGARVRSLICSLLQCCHSHRCIPWMPGQRGRVSGGREKEGRGKNFHSSTSLGLSPCVKVGQHTHTHIHIQAYTHTHVHTEYPHVPNCSVSLGLASRTWWGEVLKKRSKERTMCVDMDSTTPGRRTLTEDQGWPAYLLSIT